MLGQTRSDGAEWRRWTRRIVVFDEGASAVEYALIIGLIAVIAAAAYFGLGQMVLGLFGAGEGAYDQ